MSADFAGGVALAYARYRRDLPADQAAELAAALGLRRDDVLVDLGAGTGQLTVPLRRHCASVLAVDPEPDVLALLEARGVAGVSCVVGDDGDLVRLADAAGIAGRVGAVVIGNALHWMDERSALAAGASVLRAGGGIAVITQGPPLWRGASPWQRAVRQAIEAHRGPVAGSCGAGEETLDRRAALLEDLDLLTEVHRWEADHRVDADWVIGHLASAMPDGALDDHDAGGLAAAVRAALAGCCEGDLVERVVTTALVAWTGLLSPAR